MELRIVTMSEFHKTAPFGRFYGIARLPPRESTDPWLIQQTLSYHKKGGMGTQIMAFGQVANRPGN